MMLAAATGSTAPASVTLTAAAAIVPVVSSLCWAFYSDHALHEHHVNSSECVLMGVQSVLSFYSSLPHSAFTLSVQGIIPSRLRE